ncbi:UDP-N-acetylglucosaminyltransferase, partial [Metarhizium brunneum ARSEF 3297]
MLPAPPMHPGTVPGPQAFNSLSNIPGQEANGHNDGHARRFVPNHRRSFPIRISQSSQQAAMPTAHLGSFTTEHNLRRKTPGGTVEAGYDGSPIQPFPGPPPLKQMILPISAGLTSYFPPDPLLGSIQPPHIQFNVLGSSYSHGSHPPANLQPGAWAYSDATPNGFDLSTVLNSGSRLLNTSNVQAMGQPSDLYQPVIRANEHNLRAFCPPPAPTSGSLLFGHMGWQPGSSPWDHSNYDKNPGLGIPYTAPDINHTGYGQHGSVVSQHSQLYGKYQGLDRGTRYSGHSPRWGFQTYQGPRSRTDGQRVTSIGESHLRDKALQQSYQSYVELLSYLQASGKTSPTRSSPGSFSSCKLPAYPKPPKLQSLRMVKSANLAGPNATSANSMSQGSAEHGGRCTLDSGRSLHRHAPYSQPTPNGNNVYSLEQKFVSANPSISAPSFSNITTAVHPLPVSNALTSLDILNNLCEQTKWQWIEGMLVGGCLLYCLERYDDALKWFSAIIKLDSGQVEATTHLGAALYCLGRQDEAEQNWLRAVKLEPSYLDATEHLVGYLYKNRSGEAIEVIAYVQKALGPVIASTSSTQSKAPLPILGSGNELVVPGSQSQFLNGGGSSNTPGFGSSGYLLSGIDNGRMLALVHAKGTLLYSQKDTERASEAFQEAVLISLGRQVTGIQELIRRIQVALSPRTCQNASSKKSQSLQPLMLSPEKARHTAHLVFGGTGELPGLQFLRNGPSKRAAVQTTSNSLLSLAKILQDAMSSGKVDFGLFRGSSQVGDILALYYLSLSLQESPSTANNVGILLAGVQQGIAAFSNTAGRTMPQTSIPGIAPGSGLALALAYYNYGLKLDPNHVHLYTNLGSLLKDVGQLDFAIGMYERAVSCDGTFDIALTNLANAVKDKGRINDAIHYYRRAVNANPGFAEAVCGLFTALNSVCNWRGRGGVFLESGKYDRWHVNSEGMLVDAQTSGCSSGLTRRVVDIVSQQLKDASHWGQGMLRESAICDLAKQLQHLCKDPSFQLEEALRRWADQPWEGSRLLRLIERATRVLLRKSYRDRYLCGQTNKLSYDRPKLSQNLSVPSAPTVLPFHTFTCPLTARHIRAIAQRNALRISSSTLRSPWIPSTMYPPPSPPNPHLNVGYISSDFNNHPLAHLMQSAFGFHNPDRVQAICYATTPSDGSVHRQQIENEAPVFRDVSNWPPDKLVEQITRDNIHILVNLNGYTRGARNEIFAARPAPIQMSFMGFAGTLGAEWCDYILADTTAVPSTTLRPWRDNVSIEDVFCDNNEDTTGDWVYSENVIFCRDTFFCCDHAQSCAIDEKETEWAEVERRRWKMRKELFPRLGNDAIILGNFNQLYKIDPTIFRAWLRILARVPRAVLWLLRFPEPGESNLRATAKAWAGPEVADRIIFTDVAPKSQHISRATVCDMFLDTPECNAHTTAADVLWSSTPLLTLPRYPYKMCSRMAASILRGALPRSLEGQQAAEELITDTEAGYEQRAADLANSLEYTMTSGGYGQSSGRLADIRKLLWDSKWHCGLFNTRRWVEDLETAYEEAWKRWVNGAGGDIYL